MQAMKYADIKKLWDTGNYKIPVYRYCDGLCRYCSSTDACLNYQILSADGVLGYTGAARPVTDSLVEDRFVYAMERVFLFADKIGFNHDGKGFCQVSTAEMFAHPLVAEASRCSAATSELLLRLQNIPRLKSIKRKIAKAFDKKRRRLNDGCYACGIDKISSLSAMLPSKLAAVVTAPQSNSTYILGTARLAIESAKIIVSAWDMVLDTLPKKEQPVFLELLCRYYWIMASVEASYPDAGKYRRKGLDL
jgi:hypothetical protein